MDRPTPQAHGTEAEVECPGCGTTIRSYLGDQRVIQELRAQGWGPPLDPGTGLVDELAERLRVFQLRLGENTAGLIADGRRTVHLAPDERRELAEQLAVLVDELVEQRMAGDGDGVPPGLDGCRTERVVVDGKEEVVRVHAAEPMSEEARAAFGEMVSAARRRIAATSPYLGVIQELLAADRIARWCIPDGPHTRFGQHDGAAVRDRLKAAVRAARDALSNHNQDGDATNV